MAEQPSEHESGVENVSSDSSDSVSIQSVQEKHRRKRQDKLVPSHTRHQDESEPVEVADGLASGPRLEPYEPPLEQPTSPEQPTGNEAAVTHSSSMPSSASSSAEKAACGGPVVSDSEPSDLIEKNNASILSGDGGPPPEYDRQDTATSSLSSGSSTPSGNLRFKCDVKGPGVFCVEIEGQGPSEATRKFSEDGRNLAETLARLALQSRQSSPPSLSQVKEQNESKVFLKTISSNPTNGQNK